MISKHSLLQIEKYIAGEMEGPDAFVFKMKLLLDYKLRLETRRLELIHLLAVHNGRNRLRLTLNEIHTSLMEQELGRRIGEIFN